VLHKTVVIAGALALAAFAASAATTKNDDSCDIAVTPAATLLLPYFEIDISSAANAARTTVFSIINTSAQPQIARVTLWTDWAFPAYSFDLFLTGYDVQSVNLRDVFVAGRVPSTPVGVVPGSRSETANANPNHLPTMLSDCANRPQSIPPDLAAELRRLFTTGRASGSGISCATSIGGAHTNAIGYATIDVVATCSPLNASSSSYFSTELLFDNVLTGDYEQIDPDTTFGNYAGGSPLVHIRAIPEGGPAGSSVATNLPFTFYDRLTVASAKYDRSVDRRQPLPAIFAVRYLQTTSDRNPSEFKTQMQIWREGTTGANATCSSYVLNSQNAITDNIRFDEWENSFDFGSGVLIGLPFGQPTLAATSSIATTSAKFPQNPATASPGGWLYINASHAGFGTRGSQNWITITMSAEGRYGTTFDATPLANGCSATPKIGAQIGPGANVTPCFTRLLLLHSQSASPRLRPPPRISRRAESRPATTIPAISP
jgi:hypothetical protein